MGSQLLTLPIVAVSGKTSIASLVCVDHGVKFLTRAAAELAELLRPFEVEIVVSVASLGIAVAVEVTRALGLDDYLILHKTPKVHLSAALSEPLRSITTVGGQRALLDVARVPALTGRRVAIVDDVISTGGSSRAALALVRRAGGEPVVLGALLTEAGGWRHALGDDAVLVTALGSLPLLQRCSDGSLVERWDGEVDEIGLGPSPP
ncbi:MAG: phosphoribosyltransferase family protein [Acidimicrobiales bacterium]